MGEGKAIVCIQCGRAVGDPPVLNELPEGGNCPACAERLLEALPPIFHAPPETPDGAPVPEEQLGYEEHESGDEDYSGFEGFEGGESA